MSGSDGMLNKAPDDGAIARHGWAALLGLLEAKGLITEHEARAVIERAYNGASWSSATRSSYSQEQINQLLSGAAASPQNG